MLELWTALVIEWPKLQLVMTSVITIGLLSLALGWVVGRFMYSSRIDTQKSQVESLQERVRLRDDQLAVTRADLDAAKARPEKAEEIISDLRERLTALEPYGLSKERAAAMLHVLRSTKAGVIVSVHVDAPDALHLFQQVCGLLEQARWAVNELKGIIGFDNAPDCGVMLIKNPGSSDDVLAMLRSALNAARLDFIERDLSNAPPGGLTLPQISFSSRDRNYVPLARWS